METTIIEVEECLTDQCQVCTGYYENDIFFSKIICKCKCHILKFGNKKLTNVEDEMEMEHLMTQYDSENENMNVVLGRVGRPEYNTTLSVPLPSSQEVEQNDQQG